MKKNDVLEALSHEPSIGLGYRDLMNVMTRIKPEPIYTYSYEFPKLDFSDLNSIIVKNCLTYEKTKICLIHHEKNGNPFYELNLVHDFLLEIRCTDEDFVDRSITIYSYRKIDYKEVKNESSLLSLLKVGLDSEQFNQKL